MTSRTKMPKEPQLDAGRGYDWIRALKNETGKNIPDLIVLARNNDPFFVGSPIDLKQAKWFAAMWEKEYQGQSGIHIRRVHYHLDAIKFRKLDGMGYRNCKADWCRLVECSKAARLLGLVPADSFDDHRNADPYPLHWRTAHVGAPVLDAYQSEWSLPSVRLDLASSNWTLDPPRVDGYDPDDFLDRAYLLEIWIEKSTADDILVPIARELGIRLVPSSGFQSISNTVKLLQRVRELGKPTRIFYISDYDKAGRTMPVAVARQIEFWLPMYAPRADVKLKPLALTHAQIIEHDLPLSIDDKKRVELDALEALVPGELAKIVREAVAPYLDETVDDQLDDTRREAKRIVRDKWLQLTLPHEEKLQALQKSVKSVTKKYEREAADLNKRLSRELATLKKPLSQLQSDVAELSDNFSPDLPPRPAQTKTNQDETGWLFDSSRSYVDQLAFFKTYQGDKNGK